MYFGNMKARLLCVAILIAVCSCQRSEDSHALTKEEVVTREQRITQNRKWAWFKPLDSSTLFIAQEGTWTREAVTPGMDSSSTVSMHNRDKSMKITTVAMQGMIMAHMVVLKENYEGPEFVNMITSGVKREADGRWIDKENNAVITFSKQPGGNQVCYKVEYKEFYN